MPKEEKSSFVFKLKVSQEEIEQFILRMLLLDNQITDREEKCFKQMSKVGKNYYMEFVVCPKKEE